MAKCISSSLLKAFDIGSIGLRTLKGPTLSACHVVPIRNSCASAACGGSRTKPQGQASLELKQTWLFGVIKSNRYLGMNEHHFHESPHCSYEDGEYSDCF